MSITLNGVTQEAAPDPGDGGVLVELRHGRADAGRFALHHHLQLCGRRELHGGGSRHQQDA
ncbi:MAG: hypothetical protein MZV70_42545 [Desulfobacterales bacterium]|nr:hypothetical protein [Desulfobacterales bacterium]